MIQESFLVQPYAPFRLDLTVWALRRRAINRIDRWDGTHYTRIFVVDSVPVKVCMSQRQTDNNPKLLVNVYSPAPIAQVSSRIREALQRMFGLQVDVTGFLPGRERSPLVSSRSTIPGAEAASFSQPVRSTAQCVRLPTSEPGCRNYAVDTWVTRQKENVFSSSGEGKEWKDYENEHY